MATAWSSDRRATSCPWLRRSLQLGMDVIYPVEGHVAIVSPPALICLFFIWERTILGEIISNAHASGTLHRLRSTHGPTLELTISTPDASGCDARSSSLNSEYAMLGPADRQLESFFRVTALVYAWRRSLGGGEANTFRRIL
ncbi:hypothetical protein BU23DRAFT_119486 [Bimuria novae-zelandiae CBS 107.79]|uniref:Uncharacterized protein n=1 Tax=Bimuria novae-zelandiae CBS 107.79 TaxID=1447943 RepID=A0A6A5VAP1_9PLEO|nr:hypothetical protein BU23DRAFT_119486 [Bimuria novae-zelandiae CBS 107.79]